MRDKELRDLFVKRNEVFDKELKKLYDQIFRKDLSHLYSHISYRTITYIPERSDTLLGKMIKLEKQVNELLDNQKLIMDFLGIQKVEEPAKTYMITTSELKGKPERD